LLADVEFCANASDIQNASGIIGRKRMLYISMKHLEPVTMLVDAFVRRALASRICSLCVRRPAMDVISRIMR
jgi:hypothetical protein